MKKGIDGDKGSFCCGSDPELGDIVQRHNHGYSEPVLVADTS